jgi:hypothetical protein
MKLNFKILILIILFTWPSISFSQEINKLSPWILKLNTTALVDEFTFPTVLIGVEKKINNSFSIQTEVGYQLYDLSNEPDTTHVKVGGYKISIEGRFYICNYFKKDKTKKRKSDGLYTGVQVFYRENKYNESVTYSKDETPINDPLNDPIPINDYEDNYGVIKKVLGLNFGIGFQKQVHNFIWEPYVHLGIMNRKVRNTNREFNEDLGHIEYYGHNFARGISKEEDSGYSGNFGFGFRVGYLF